MLKYVVPFAFVLFAASHANAWTKYGGDTSCRELLTLVDAGDQMSEQMARGWTLGYISALNEICLLYTSPSPRDRTRSRMPSSA